MAIRQRRQAHVLAIHLMAYLLLLVDTPCVNNDRPERIKQTAVVGFIAVIPGITFFKTGISNIQPINTKNPISATNTLITCENNLNTATRWMLV
jgi:hypothetical protein